MLCAIVQLLRGLRDGDLGPAGSRKCRLKRAVGLRAWYQTQRRNGDGAAEGGTHYAGALQLYRRRQAAAGPACRCRQEFVPRVVHMAGAAVVRCWAEKRGSGFWDKDSDWMQRSKLRPLNPHGTPGRTVGEDSWCARALLLKQTCAGTPHVRATARRRSPWPAPQVLARSKLLTATTQPATVLHNSIRRKPIPQNRHFVVVSLLSVLRWNCALAAGPRP